MKTLVTLALIFCSLFVYSQEYTKTWPSYKRLGLTPAGDGTKMGFIDESNKVVIPLIYDEVYSFTKHGITKVKLDGKFGMVNRKGDVIIPVKYDRIRDISEEKIIGLGNDEGYGYANIKGEIIVPLIYDMSWTFYGGYGGVKLDEKYGFVDSTGKVVIPVEHEDFEPFFRSGRASVMKDGKWGSVDIENNLVMPYKYDKVEWDYEEQLAVVYLDSLCGLCDGSGKEIFAPMYDKISNFNEGMAIVTIGDKQGIINAKGKVVYKPWRYKIYSYVNGYAILEGELESRGKKIKTYDFIDKKGKQINEMRLDDAWSFQENGLACVQYRGGFGFINTSGKMVIEAIYDKQAFFKNGKAKVVKEGVEGTIDEEGKFTEKTEGLEYTEIYEESEGLRGVKLTRKNGHIEQDYYGFIDADDKLVIPLDYRLSEPFKDGIARVKDDDWGFIDKNNKVIIPLKYSYIQRAGEGMIRFRDNGKYGYYNTKGKIVIPAKFNSAENFEKGFAIVSENGKKSKVDKEGNLTEYVVKTKWGKRTKASMPEGSITANYGVWKEDQERLSKMNFKNKDFTYFHGGSENNGFGREYSSTEKNDITWSYDEELDVISYTRDEEHSWMNKKYVRSAINPAVYYRNTLQYSNSHCKHIRDVPGVVVYKDAIIMFKQVNFIDLRYFTVNDYGKSCVVSKDDFRYSIDQVHFFNNSHKEATNKSFDEFKAEVKDFIDANWKLKTQEEIVTHEANAYKDWVFKTQAKGYDQSLKGKQIKSIEIEFKTQRVISYGKKFEVGIIATMTDGSIEKTTNIGGELPVEAFSIYAEGARFLEDAKFQTWDDFFTMESESWEDAHFRLVNDNEVHVSAHFIHDKNVKTKKNLYFNYAEHVEKKPLWHVLDKNENGDLPNVKCTAKAVVTEKTIKGGATAYNIKLIIQSPNGEDDFNYTVGADGKITFELKEYGIPIENKTKLASVDHLISVTYYYPKVAYGTDNTDYSTSSSSSSSSNSSSGTSSSSSSNSSSSSSGPSFSGSVYIKHDYSGSDASTTRKKLYIHIGSTIRSTSRGSSATINCKNEKIYYSFTGKKSDMKLIKQLSTDDCGKTIKSSSFL